MCIQLTPIRPHMQAIAAGFYSGILNKMDIQENVSLAAHSTMRLGGIARYLATITERHQVAEAHAWAQQQSLPVIMIGSGSNIIWRDEGFPGLVLVNNILRYEDFAEDDVNHYLTLGAGENWDSVVERSVAAGLSGIECLSLIPGSAGGTPVQNVGAYGQEIADTLVSVEVFDTQTAGFANIPAADCGFGYRTSHFKTDQRGRYFITGLTLHLTTAQPEPPFYGTLQAYLEAHQLSNPTVSDLRAAVIAIRSAKLPDPATVANNGSFFANPIISSTDFGELADKFGGDVPHWDASDDRVKVPAAWLLEQAGFKDIHDSETGMATWHAQPLVLVNERAKTTADLLAFKQKIVDAVQTKFGISLVQEPELLP
jgi:UDP-N-acetylmuramate dehydrogenase